MRLDDLDLKILNSLQTNGKISNVQLAAEIGLSPAPTLERVKKLEQNGFISGYQARLNPEKIGLNVMVYLELSFNLTEPQALDQFLETIQSYPEVTECYHISGEYDLLLKVMAPSVTAYQHFLLHKLVYPRYVTKVNTKMVLGVSKCCGVLPLSAIPTVKKNTE